MNDVFIDGERYNPVSVQDPVQEPIDLYICHTTGETTLASSAATGSESISVTSATGATLYQAACIMEGGHVFQTVITDINGTTISIGSPIDKGFSAGAYVMFSDWDLSRANGSAVSPVIYKLKPPFGVKWHIYTIIASIEDDTVMYDSTFGGIAALNNGLAARIVDGTTKQLFLITNNGGFKEYGFSVDYNGKVPSGTYAMLAEKQYPVKNGVALVLDGTKEDMIEIPVRADLTGISKFAISVHGHRTRN